MTERSEDAQAIVKRHMKWSAGMGLVPIPIIDLIAITAVDLKMLKELADHYEVPFKKERGKSIISSLVGAGLGTKLGWGTARSLVKAVPGIGSVAGYATMPIFAGASTYALGKVFIQHLDSGGTFLDFDPEKVRAHYQQELDLASEKQGTAKVGKSGKAAASA